MSLCAYSWNSNICKAGRNSSRVFSGKKRPSVTFFFRSFPRALKSRFPHIGTPEERNVKKFSRFHKSSVEIPSCSCSPQKKQKMDPMAMKSRNRILRQVRPQHFPRITASELWIFISTRRELLLILMATQGGSERVNFDGALTDFGLRRSCLLMYDDDDASLK